MQLKDLGLDAIGNRVFEIVGNTDKADKNQPEFIVVRKGKSADSAADHCRQWLIVEHLFWLAGNEIETSWKELDNDIASLRNARIHEI